MLILTFDNRNISQLRTTKYVRRKLRVTSLSGSLLLPPGSDASSGSFLRTGDAFFRRHAGSGLFSACTPTFLATLSPLFAEELQNLWWKLLFPHQPILNRVLANGKILLDLIPAFRYNQSMKIAELWRKQASAALHLQPFEWNLEQNAQGWENAA